MNQAVSCRKPFKVDTEQFLKQSPSTNRALQTLQMHRSLEECWAQESADVQLHGFHGSQASKVWHGAGSLARHPSLASFFRFSLHQENNLVNHPVRINFRQTLCQPQVLSRPGPGSPKRGKDEETTRKRRGKLRHLILHGRRGRRLTEDTPRQVLMVSAAVHFGGYLGLYEIL